MSRLLVFGGTFDPPHVGHCSILHNAIRAVGPDAVMVIPAGIPPHKAASATPARLRLEMCACFRPLFPGLLISDMELYRGGKSYSWQTVQQLRAQKPDASVYLCIGSDMLLTFTEWYHYRDLLAAVTLVVQNRTIADAGKTYAAATALKAEGGKIMFASGQVETVSSTGLRAAIACGDDTALALIPPPADDIVRRHGLYRTPKGNAL